MRICLLLLTACSLCPSVALAAKEADADKLKVVMDVSEVPELKEWSEQAEKLIREWHPKITEILAQEGYTPPQEVRVVFKKDMDGVAYTVRNQITIAGDWVKQHPEDTGMVIHELAHVIQQYRRGGRSWMVEGIADYVRFFKYEPKTRLRGINPKRQNYSDSYRTSAQFIAWVEENHPGFVQKTNAALRKGEFQNVLIREITGKSVEQLWTEFTESPAAKGRG